ncbi:MAG: ATP-binding cassette domain-containing protein, partial [Thermodesulfobacteriota bacterium]
MSNQAILKIESLKKVFAGKKTVVALDGIDLTVARNEFVVLLGPSGCGKSTLLYIIGGLLKPSAGRVLLDDKDIVGTSPERGIVFQEFALYPWRTVEENIRFGLELSSSKVRDESKIREIVRDLIKTIGLTGFEKSKPHQLSGG